MWSRQGFLAVIPARGGSKSIPQKNIKEFLGKPLLAWTIEIARESDVFERVILSTDDEKIAQIGRAYGAEVPFLRPRELAEDTTPTAPVVRHALEWLRNHEGWTPDFVIVLEPTSPGRRAFHIRDAVSLVQKSGADSVASISDVPHHYVPPKVLQLHDDRTITGIDGTHLGDMIHHRQDLPVYYAFNGLIFGCKIDVLSIDPLTLWGEKVVAYLVDQKYNIDIDNPEDWVIAEARMRNILKEKKAQ
ncbi:acylneuraminate cytidylyltransferase family protein [Desulfobacterota bacterium AH_259_B03_O07]|nr:acylneuraminate cytidylyltransferase family protein [Desulfobacterota bacterium AH_259_B03_O07]